VDGVFAVSNTRTNTHTHIAPPFNTTTTIYAVDCTTNPSLVYKAVQQPEYARFLADALAAKGKAGPVDAARPFAGMCGWQRSVVLGGGW
jgi:hypothetical protein